MKGKSSVWVQQAKVEKPMHLNFRAEDRGQVDAFHRSALAAGGKDNGKPGTREKNSPDYRAGFVLDPDGNNGEAVYHSS